MRCRESVGSANTDSEIFLTLVKHFTVSRIPGRGRRRKIKGGKVDNDKEAGSSSKGEAAEASATFRRASQMSQATVTP